jgi:hypothetical protein
MGSKHTYADQHSGGEAQMRISTANQSGRHKTTTKQTRKTVKTPSQQTRSTGSFPQSGAASRQKRKQTTNK